MGFIAVAICLHEWTETNRFRHLCKRMALQDQLLLERTELLFQHIDDLFYAEAKALEEEGK